MGSEARPSRLDTGLDRICRPRLPGSEAVREVEAEVTGRLESLGLRVARQEFTTNARRLYAASLGAAGVGWAALMVSPLYVFPVSGWSAVVVVLGAFAAVGLLSLGIAEGRLPFDTPAVPAVNLVARRGSDPVRVWLVAHLDSKTQPISLRGRILAGLALGLGLALMLGALVVRVATPLAWYAMIGPVLLTVAGAAAMSRGPLRDGSAGAVDNGTGILAVLAAADALRDRSDVGVLLTGAEEFGMEGARVFAAASEAAEWFVNFDGIDDRGRFNVMTHRAGGADVQRLKTALIAALGRRGESVRAAALPLGVFVDGSVLARGGTPGVTVSRGDGETLAVVHTTQDVPGRLTGSSALTAGAAAADALRRLLG